MTLAKCIKIGKECGLETVGEAYDNIIIHSTMLFEYSKMNNEIAELNKEIVDTYGKQNLDKIYLFQ